MIEQLLERIAVALEKIAAAVNQAPPVVEPKKTKKAPEAAVPVQAAPVAETFPGDEPAAPAPSGKVLICEAIKTPEQLRDFVQKALEKAGTHTNSLVTFIKGEVCKKYTPTEPKLIKIPVANVADASQMVYDWCLNHGIILE